MIRVLCVGTATEVGKTWVGGQVLDGLRRSGLRVAARKPVQSFDPDDPAPTDAEVLAAATGEDLDVVCPAHRSYPMALAPPVAAALLARPVPTMAELRDELVEPTGDVDLCWLETVGGPLSPIADDGDSADVARWFNPDVVVLVTDGRLGAINAVRLAAIPFAGRRLVVYMNRYEDSAVFHSNWLWLIDNGFDVETNVARLAQRIIDGLP